MEKIDEKGATSPVWASSAHIYLYKESLTKLQILKTRWSVIYQNIFVEDRYSDEPTVHLWDDEEGYNKFEFPDYAFIRNEYGDFETMWGDPVMKIPKKNLDGRKKVELQDAYGEDAIHESDVPIETRVLVDFYDDNEISDGHRRFFYDIEVATDGGFPDPGEAKQKITSLAYYDEAAGRKAVLILDEAEELDRKTEDGIEIIPYRSERALLEGILKHWQEANPTIISGWNCIPTDSFVWGKNEIKEIGSLKPEDSLSGCASDVERVYPKSEKEEYEIKLDDGTSVFSSAEHRFPIVEKTGKYSRLNEFSSTCESKVATTKEISDCKNPVYLRYELGENPNSESSWKENEAYLAGLIFADGHYSQSENRVSVYNNEKSVINSVSEHFEIQSYEDDRHENSTYHLRTKRINRENWDKVLSLIYEDGEKKLDVNKLSQLPTPTFCSFLSGLIDGDGCITDPKERSENISISLQNGSTERLVTLLRWNGIDCTTSDNRNTVYISTEKRTLEVLKNLCLQHQKKKKRLSEYGGYDDKGAPSHSIKKMRQDDYCLVRVSDVEKTGETVEMVDIKTDTGYFNTSYGVKTHNCDTFDNPYLYNRLERVLGEEKANKLSPIEKVKEKRISGSDRNGYEFAGISSLDYIRIYKNFTFSEQPSYSLDYISNEELDRGKVEYEGMEVDGEVIQDLDDLKRLDIERFIKYNFEDVQLVADIDEKLNFIEMARFISHLGHVPYEDVYMSSRFIEGAILNRLHQDGIVAPDNERGKTSFEVDGWHKIGTKEIQVKKDKIHDDIPRKGTIGVDKASTKTKREKVDYKKIEGDRFILEEQMDFAAEDGASIGLEFAGAYVKKPNPGTYEWIYDLDLTSMYPCIIMGLNISPETKVAKVYGWDVHDFATKNDKSYRVWIFDRSGYKEFDSSGELQDWIEKNNYSVAANGAVYRNDKKGIIADILEDWFENRQEYKTKRNEAREAGNEEEAEYYDKQQHNRKILINSVYGVLGLPVFRFYDIDNAEATTATGVSTIKYTQLMGDTYYKKHGNSELGQLNECIYTDSVPGYEPVIVRDENDEVDIRPIEEIENDWESLEVWSDEGWTKINDFIKKPNRKQLYTTRTREGVVHTTEDHSLVREDGSEVSPNEIEEGEKLLHNRIPEKTNWKGNEDAEKAWLLGFFVAEGSCGSYDTDYGRKHSWAVNNQEEGLLEKSASIMESEYGVGTKIDEVIESSNTNKLRLNGNGYGSVRDISHMFREKCYTSDAEKRVPKEILNSESREVVEAFLDGLHDGDGRVNERYTKRWHEFTTKSSTLASGISYLLQKLGYESGVSYRRNYGNEYYKVSCQDWFRKGSKEVDEVEEIEYDGNYVYDLETENHHFHCGIGSIVVHNTDSVFYSATPLLDFDPDDADEDKVIDATIEKAKELQAYLNDSYDYYAREMLNIPEGQHRFDIKQELVASRGMWMAAKKRYAYWIVNDEGDPTSELGVKGMDIVRSDFPPAFDSLMEEVIVTILKENDQKKVDNLILNFEEKLHDFPIEKVANPTGVGDASDYQKPTLGHYEKGAPVYFKAALAYNDLIDHFDLSESYEKISDDSKIKWVYLHDNPLGLAQVGLRGTDDPPKIMEFIEKYADYDKMYEKALKSKLKDIYDAIDWDFPSAGKKRAETFFEFS